MTASPMSQRVGHTLDAYMDCARLLQSTLQEEHEALLSNNVAALEQVTRTKSSASERLDVLGAELNQLRAQSSANDIGAFLSGVDPSGRSLTQWQELIEIARRCSEANRENAALLEARRGQIRNALNLLGGNTSGSSTYGRSGATPVLPGPRSFGSA